MNSEGTFKLAAVTRHQDRYVVLNVSALLAQGCIIHAAHNSLRGNVRVVSPTGVTLQDIDFLSLPHAEACDDRSPEEIRAEAEHRGEFELDAEAGRLFDVLGTPTHSSYEYDDDDDDDY